MPRIGFASRFIAPDDELAMRQIADSDLAKITRKAFNDRIANTVKHNVATLDTTLRRIAKLPPHQRMFRIDSALLPGFAGKLVRSRDAYKKLRPFLDIELAMIGRFARDNDIRLSFRAQNALTDTDQGVREVNYLAHVAVLMGYTEWQDVTIAARLARNTLDAFPAFFPKLSPTARDLLAIENDATYGLTDLDRLGRTVPLVADLHAHWLMTKGRYLEPDEPEAAAVRASWRGKRPFGRLALPRMMAGVVTNAMPAYHVLVEAGNTASEIAMPAETMWSSAVNDWACRHLAWMDIEVDAAQANLAAQKLADHAVMSNYLHL